MKKLLKHQERCELSRFRRFCVRPLLLPFPQILMIVIVCALCLHLSVSLKGCQFIIYLLVYLLKTFFKIFVYF